MVVVVLPSRRDRPGVNKAIEDLEGEALVTEASVEALGEDVLPGATGLDVERRDTDAIEPGSKLVGDELGPVVAADVLGTPRIANSSASVSMPSPLVMPRSTFSVRHPPPIYSSITRSRLS